MTNSDHIRYRADGSIDTGYYMALGREMRSSKAHEIFGRTPECRRRAPAPRRMPFFG